MKNPLVIALSYAEQPECLSIQLAIYFFSSSKYTNQSTIQNNQKLLRKFAFEKRIQLQGIATTSIFGMKRFKSFLFNVDY